MGAVVCVEEAVDDGVGAGCAHPHEVAHRVDQDHHLRVLKYHQNKHHHQDHQHLHRQENQNHLLVNQHPLNPHRPNFKIAISRKISRMTYL